MYNFTGVDTILKLTGNEVEFVDRCGQTVFATIDSAGAELKLLSMKVECPVCFGEPETPPCFLCFGAGKV
jgi:hypothetical protein